MLTRAQAAFLPLLLLPLLAACKVGQPLVGEKKFKPGDLHLLCSRPPKCDDPWQPDPLPDHPAQPLDGCARPKLCQLADEELGLGGCPREKLETLPLDAACEELELLADDDTGDLNLQGVFWDEVNLTLRTEKPISVAMNGGTLTRVHMQLEGPISLRIEHLELLVDVRIAGAAGSGGAPSVSFDSVRGQRLSVGSAEQPFPGSINLHALGFEDIDVRAKSCNFESVLLQEASVRSDAVVFTDVTLSRALLETNEAIVSAYNIEDSVLRFCGDVRLIAGDITRSELSACLDHPTRLYASKFNSGILDGAFELDDVHVNGSRVASRNTTRILAYNSQFDAAQLCDDLELLALASGSSLRCSDCYDAMAEEEPLCALEALKDPLSGNYCSAWEDIDQLASCSGDLPTEPNRLR